MVMRWLGPLVLSLFVGVSPAYSTVYQVTVSGHILPSYNDDGEIGHYSDDGLTLFGPAHETYDGQPFSATFLINDSAPGAYYYISATQASAEGGPDYPIGSASPVTASITINGSTYDLNADRREQGTNHGSVAVDLDAIRPYEPNIVSLSFNVEHDESYDVALDYGLHSQLAFYLELPDTTRLSDFFSPGSIDIYIPQDGYYGPDHYYNGYLEVGARSSVTPYGTDSFAYFQADRFTIGPAVPEAGTWAMMILGLGMAGASIRRRQGVATRMMA